MVMNRAQFARQLLEGINTIFGMEYREYPELWRQSFEVSRSRKAYEEDVLNIGLGLARVKPEGQGIEYDGGREAWTKRYQHETIALGFVLTEEAIDDNLYGSLSSKYAKGLARSLQQTKEIKGHAIWNNAFDSNYVGGDGKELLATDHPLAYGGTFANELSTPADLSETALEDAIIRIKDFVDDRGLRINAMPKKLIVPNTLMFTAERILKSSLRPGTADNDVNATKSLGYFSTGFAATPYLTDPDAWFIVTDVQDGLKHMVRKNVQRGQEGDFDTGNFKYKATERYAFGWTDPRGAFGSPGSGT